MIDRVGGRMLAAVLTGLLATTGARAAAITPPATLLDPLGPAPAALHLVVRHSLESGRLVVRVGPDAYFSGPLRALGGTAPGSAERLLSIPGGEQTITVQIFDGRGRFVVQKQTRANVSAPGPAILDVRAGTNNGATDLSLTWRERL